MLHPSPFGHDPMFTLVPIFIFAVFAIVVISIIVRVAKGMSDWSYNNRQPVRSEAATVVSKRMEVNGTKHHSSTTYYATFELPGAERREFKVSGSEYGQLAEGDRGTLKSQGSRFLVFERQTSTDVGSNELPPPVGPELYCDYCGTANSPSARKCSSCGSGKLSATALKTEI